MLNFIVFGVSGWCMEILWTGFSSLLRHDFKLIANTSLWMFFIYGLAVFLGPLCGVVAGFPIVVRGLIYMSCILAAEFVTGIVLKTLGVCPWDYSGSRFSVLGVIRLDYIPVWFAAGLIIERIHYML